MTFERALDLLQSRPDLQLENPYSKELTLSEAANYYTGLPPDCVFDKGDGTEQNWPPEMPWMAEFYRKGPRQDFCGKLYWPHHGHAGVVSVELEAELNDPGSVHL